MIAGRVPGVVIPNIGLRSATPSIFIHDLIALTMLLPECETKQFKDNVTLNLSLHGSSVGATADVTTSCPDILQALVGSRYEPKAALIRTGLADYEQNNEG